MAMSDVPAQSESHGTRNPSVECHVGLHARHFAESAHCHGPVKSWSRGTVSMHVLSLSLRLSGCHTVTVASQFGDCDVCRGLTWGSTSVYACRNLSGHQLRPPVSQLASRCQCGAGPQERLRDLGPAGGPGARSRSITSVHSGACRDSVPDDPVTRTLPLSPAAVAKQHHGGKD
jgi:hypothetical protein